MLNILIVLAVIGVLWWLFNQAPFIQPQMKTIVNYVILVFVILWLLQAFGVLDRVGTVRVR